VPHESEPWLLVLHALRLKGFAGPEALAASAGLPESEVGPVLDGLARRGLAGWRNGRVSGWSLTSLGREEHNGALTDELAVAGQRDQVERAYRRFVSVNQELLNTCTAWQLRQTEGKTVVNDHEDGRYDGAVIERLAAVHEVARPVCRELSAAMNRYSTYGPRLQHALDRVRAGELDWFTRPVMDSYHTVWFELHEDLLLTLGLERAKEPVQ
jgi:hypothetical protein